MGNLWRLSRQALSLIWPGLRHAQSARRATRGALTHVIVLDGTMSSLRRGRETNAGLTWRLLQDTGNDVSTYYEAGVQWADWRSTPDVVVGRGINRQIRRAYGYLASRYRPGDRIFLFGYSRGAYAVRSLAGLIDQVGLLRSEHATERQIQLAYRHYQTAPGGHVAGEFRAAFCHTDAQIEMIGVWDTVKALGLRLPLFWRWSQPAHAFHSHALGHATRHGYHALALDETREVYAPVLWQTPDDWDGRVEQVWFPGCHGDVGGQLGDFTQARPLSNIPLVWMLDKAAGHGLPLPEGWRAGFPMDANAPSVGTWSGWGKLFLLRRKRVVGADKSERLYRAERDADRTAINAPA